MYMSFLNFQKLDTVLCLWLFIYLLIEIAYFKGRNLLYSEIHHTRSNKPWFDDFIPTYILTTCTIKQSVAFSLIIKTSVPVLYRGNKIVWVRMNKITSVR